MVVKSNTLETESQILCNCLEKRFWVMTFSSLKMFFISPLLTTVVLYLYENSFKKLFPGKCVHAHMYTL